MIYIKNFLNFVSKFKLYILLALAFITFIVGLITFIVLQQKHDGSNLNMLPSPTPSYTKIPSNIVTATPSTIKPTAIIEPRKIYYKDVKVIIFDPKDNISSKSLIQRKNWNSPDKLVDEYIQAIKDITNDSVNYKVVDQIVIADFTVLQGGMAYTNSTMDSCLSNNQTCYKDESGNLKMMDYNWMLETYDVCEDFNAGEFDELWMFGGPYFGFYEAVQTGNLAFETNGPVITGSNCLAPLNIMGFSYERGVSEMLEDLGHRVEGTMRKVSQVKLNSDWNEFSMFNHSSQQGYSGCGNVHFAPNSTSDYDWGATTIINTYCDQYENYPNIDETELKKVNCREWECSSIGYLKWWLAHIPHNPGVNSNGLYNDWWEYILNPIKVHE